MRKLLEFFEDGKGRLSSQRLIFITGSYFTMWLTAYMIIKSGGENWDGAMAIFLSLFGSFAAGKLVQKNIEPKDKDEPKLPQ